MSHKKTHVIVTPPLWVSNLVVFFRLPNPRIFQLFIISSTATLSLGIAMVVEWVYHGRHRPGYHWILYYAPSMLALLVLVWIVCFVSSNIFTKKDQLLYPLPILDHSDSNHSSNQHQQDADSQNHTDDLSHLTIVPLHAGLRSSTAQLASEVKDDDKFTLHRAFSFPLSYTVFDIGKIKRTKSF
ncbi:uncharacterized protein LOC132295715 [Cornus florida]|uniref:uncharacterized protein LOC132295715 n=1 Tax=Cornus florida TaxID=4283 RepID=UPI002896D87C|nr:uncharacterized protein LOC132295715 [Cornus florida]